VVNHVNVLIAGGGTGGHVYPMTAVADALRQLPVESTITFVGTGRGIEARVIPERGDVLEMLDVLPLRGRGVMGFARGALRACMVVPDARRLVRRLAPAVVFSVGGYAAGPITLAARSLGVPVTMMEPNAVLGFTNRVLKPLVRRAYVCFPETRDAFTAERVRWTGVPLRQRFEPKPPPEPSADGCVRLLVLGGSQGAQALNEAVPRALARCREQGLAFNVVHQAGRDKDAAVRALYDELGFEGATVTPFIDDVASALAASEVVVERSGAGSLAELCAVGRPGILIPYPYAADDHQRRNAESLERDGAAVCVPQSEASDERLAVELARLAGDEELRRGMAARALARGRPDAAHDVALDLLRLAGIELGDEAATRAVAIDGPPRPGGQSQRTRAAARAAHRFGAVACATYEVPT